MDQSPAVGMTRPSKAGLGSPVSLDHHDRTPFLSTTKPTTSTLLHRIDPALAPRGDPLVCYAPRQQVGLASATIPDQCRLVDRRDKPLLPPALEHTARILHQIDPTGGQLRPPLGRGHKEVQAELGRKKCGSQLALHTIAGCIEPRREGTQPALAG
jgi:hypothetical protein